MELLSIRQHKGEKQWKNNDNTKMGTLIIIISIFLIIAILVIDDFKGE